MDLYYVVTNYHLLCVLLHKIKYNKNDAILLISEYLTETRPDLVDKLKKENIFTNIYIIDKPIFYDSDEFLSKKKLDKRIEKINNKVENKYSKIIKNKNSIYTCCDFDELGIYLIKNNIKYNYFEDGCGIFSREDIVLRVVHIRKKFIQELKCLGNNKNVINRFGSLKDQKEGYKNPKDIDFCVKDILKKLSKKDIDLLLRIYNVKRINLKKEKLDLLLTMHYNEIMSIETQKEIYTNLLDYFKSPKEKLIIKPHPADSIFNYEELFPNSIVLNRYMPSELFPYCIETKFEKGITCWSTAIYSLNKIIKKAISFDEKIDTTYKEFDKYYAITKILKNIKSKEKYNLKLININQIQLERLLEQYFGTYKKYFYIDNQNDCKNEIYIVDKIYNEIKDKKVIALNTSLDCQQALLVERKFENLEKKEIIGIYNFDEICLKEKKEMEYSKSTLNISSIKKDEYNKVLFQLFEEEKISKELIKDKFELQLNEKERKITELNYKIKEIYNSTSWKITKPIRKIKDLLRKFK